MKFRIHHETAYRYSAPVYLGRQVLRLRPLSDANQHLLQFQMNVSPSPAGCSDLADLDGNHSTAIWFDAPADSLRIETESTVETVRTNPFDYIWDGASALPLRYPSAYEGVLTPYRTEAACDAVKVLGEEVVALAGRDAQSFLGTLTHVLHERLPQVVRPYGAPLEPQETLQRGEGSCRDLAVLFMAVARFQGFAARFVSGYQTIPAEDGSFDLHAWAEAYVPGGGWRGFDPTVGLAVSDRHVGLATAAGAAAAAPVSGTFSGKATVELDARIRIEVLP